MYDIAKEGRRLCEYILSFKNKTIYSVRVAGNHVGRTHIFSAHQDGDQ